MSEFSDQIRALTELFTGGYRRNLFSHRMANGSYMIILPIEGGDVINVPARYIMSRQMTLSKNQLSNIFYNESLDIFNDIFTYEKPDGSFVMLLMIVFSGECTDSFSKMHDQFSLRNTASYYSKTRGIVLPRETKNFGEDVISLESFSTMKTTDYIVICISYGANSTYYCMTKDTINRVYDTSLKGDNLYRMCIKDSRGVFAINTHIYVPLPLNYQVYVDLYSFYRIYCLTEIRHLDSEYIIVYLEVMHTGLSLCHADSVSDSNALHCMGRALISDGTSIVKEIPLTIGENLKLSTRM